MNLHPQKSKPPLARQIFAAVTLIYCVAFLLWQLLVKSPLYETWWWLQVSQIFGLVGYLPAPLLLPGAIAFRSRSALLGLMIPFIWLGIEYGALFWPNDNPPIADVAGTPSQSEPLRVMTWNTGTTIGYGGNTPQALQSAVATVQPDLILMQEVGPESVQHLQELADEFPYHTYGIAGGRARLAIASKWQFVEEKLDEDPQGCHCLRVTVAWHEQLIDVVAVHVVVPNYNMNDWHGVPVIRAFDASEQTTIFDGLVNLSHSELPLVIAGDFNSTERQPSYQRMKDAGLRDAHEESGVGFGLTFPRPGAFKRWWLLPLLRIDHIFYSDEWSATRSWTGIIPSSDHLYVVSDLRLLPR